MMGENQERTHRIQETGSSIVGKGNPQHDSEERPEATAVHQTLKANQSE